MFSLVSPATQRDPGMIQMPLPMHRSEPGKVRASSVCLLPSARGACRDRWPQPLPSTAAESERERAARQPYQTRAASNPQQTAGRFLSRLRANGQLVRPHPRILAPDARRQTSSWKCPRGRCDISLFSPGGFLGCWLFDRSLAGVALAPERYFDGRIPGT